jgi:hypothetical protein
MSSNLKRKRVALALVIATAVPLLLRLSYALFAATLFGGNPFDNNPFDDRSFNRTEWFEDSVVVDGSNQRGRMALDVVKQLPQGTSRQSIVAMLGEGYELGATVSNKEHYYPSVAYFSSGNPTGSGKVLRYYLGEELAMAWGIDRAELFLYLDTQDRYRAYKIGWWSG